MPDQATNSDIEDVLSSIRRLVTMGDRAHPAPANRPDGGALVLTPALRIARDTSTPPQEGDTDAPSGLREEEAHSADVLPVGAGEGADTGGPGDPARDPDEPLSLEPFAAGEEPDDDDAPTMPPAATLGIPDRSMLEATIAELEAAVTRQVEEWEPDGSEAEPVMDWAGAEASEAAFISSRAQRRSAGMAPAAPPGEEPIAEVEDLASPADDIAAPADGPGLPEEAAAALAAAAATDDVPESPADETVPPIVAPQLDEAALRRLVAEVLREELAGELGERITRNVRRLVRREIHRSFSGSDLS